MVTKSQYNAPVRMNCSPTLVSYSLRALWARARARSEDGPMVEWALPQLLLDGITLAGGTLGVYWILLLLEKLVPYPLRRR